MTKPTSPGYHCPDRGEEMICKPKYESGKDGLDAPLRQLERPAHPDARTDLGLTPEEEARLYWDEGTRHWWLRAVE